MTTSTSVPASSPVASSGMMTYPSAAGLDAGTEVDVTIYR